MMDKIECDSDESEGFVIEDDDFEIIDIEESNEDSSNK